MTNLKNTALKNVEFVTCKLLGVKFNECEPFLFSVSFNDCNLNLSSFFNLVIKETDFDNCKLHGVDFTEADLTSSRFNKCDLKNALFDQTTLEKVDFSTSRNFSIDPDINRIKNAKFSIPEVIGLLEKYQIKIV
jgi:uncharacterized protein YjbI with pentapeptide repeats